jgi:L-fucose mutarotase/ribose pyranase (RbsD/FucU family)
MTSFTDPETAVEYARSEWESAESRLRRVAPRLRSVIEDVIDAVVSELNRRVGQNFATIDLVEAQEGAEDWCLEVAHRVAPENPDAWDLSIIQGAAFHRYSRQAQDYQT